MCHRFYIIAVWIGALLCAAPWSHAALVSSCERGGIAYFMHDTPARIVRYDLGARQWLSSITLPSGRSTVTAMHVDADGIYVAYGTAVYRSSLTGGSEIHLVNASQSVSGIFSDGNLLFICSSTRHISVNKATNTIISTFEPYYSLTGMDISPGANRLFGRSTGVSPSDIVYVAYTDAGTFTGSNDGPYHGTYPSASKVWVFPSGTQVVDSAGTVYGAAALTYSGSLGGALDQLAFHGADIPILLRGDRLISYTSGLLPAGSKSLGYIPSRIFVNGSDVMTFTANASVPSGVEERAVPLSDIAAPTPGLPVNPAGVAYTPDSVFLATNGILHLVHHGLQSIFRWDPATQQYLSTIPLLDKPTQCAYSESTNCIYVGYTGGSIRKIDLLDPNLTENAFFSLPRTPSGLVAAGPFLFAADDNGSWANTHYSINSAGSLVDSVTDRYYSKSYVWSQASQKVYYMSASERVSPIDLLWEEINANGTAYPGEPAGGIRNQKDSPFHGNESFTNPVRISPDGSLVLIGTGKLYDGQTLARSANALANSIADGTWFGTEIRTMRTITDVTQYQQWTGSSYALGLSKQYPGTAHRLLTWNSGQLIGISIASDGRPSFYVLDGSFELISPSHLAKPGHLSQTALTVNQASIAWADVSGETSYSIERKTGAGGSWGELGTTSTSRTSFVDSTAVAGNQYYYRIIARTAALASAPSDELLVNMTPPAGPATLAATAESSSVINITWSDVEAEAGYAVERASSAAGPWSQIGTTNAGVVTYRNTSLVQNTAYYYRVRANNVFGMSAYSPIASATTLQAPPSTPIISGGSAVFNRVSFSWLDVSFEESYVIERGPSTSGPWTVIATLPANTITFADTNVVQSTYYAYRLKAANTAGASSYATTSFTTPAPSSPAVPSGVVVQVISSSKLRVSWLDLSDETAYKVERRTDSPLSWTVVATLSANTTSFEDSSVQSGTQYWYRVSASNVHGTSATSPEVSAVPLDLVPLIQDDFDPDLATPVWSSVTGGAAVNGGQGFMGTNALRFGGLGTRAAVLAPLSLSGAAYLQFLFRAGNEAVDGTTYWNNSEAGEGVAIEYSINGTTWVSIRVLDTVYPSHSTWTSHFIQMPEAALAPGVMIRWRQLSNSGSGFDTWALEDVALYSASSEPPSAPPFILTSPNSATAIAIYWGSSSGATSYLVERTLNGSDWLQIATTPANQTYYTDRDLLPKSWYQYRIRAANAAGTSDPSFTSLVSTLSRMAEWRLANYGTTSADGNAASAAKGPEGVTNLAKFAFNMDITDAVMPVQSGTGWQGMPTVSVNPATQKLRVEFIRRKATSVPGVDYVVEFGSEISNFDSTGSVIEASSLDDEFERVVWEDSVSIEGSPSRFARVRIVETP